MSQIPCAGWQQPRSLADTTSGTLGCVTVDLFAALAGPAEEVAPLLLGATIRDDAVAVRIVEVEAYAGHRDPASHAFRGPGGKNAVMFGPPGHAYVYLSYGVHWCLNVVCHPEGVGGGILLRAGEVVEGVEVARMRRSGSDVLARGPGRLGQALGVSAADSGVDLRSGRLRLSGRGNVTAFSRGPRVGVSKAADRNWRFWIEGDPHVSPYRRSPRA
jgi:DNA-3-methyladenine glycosylase